MMCTSGKPTGAGSIGTTEEIMEVSSVTLSLGAAASVVDVALSVCTSGGVLDASTGTVEVDASSTGVVVATGTEGGEDAAST